MTDTDKELLLKDLCARLPYGVKVFNTSENLNKICELDSILTSRKYKDEIFVGLTLPDDEVMTGIEMVKPYLRPMSSMTEEERNDYENYTLHWCNKSEYGYASDIVDYLNQHHLDYRGLIPMGLAIEVTEENNPYKQQ